MRPDDGGDIDFVDLQRHVSVLSTGWVSAAGLAWKEDNVLFTAATRGVRALYTVTTRGRTSLIAEAPSPLTLLDVSRNHQLLISDEHLRNIMKVVARDSHQERDLSWLDYSAVRDLAPDGQTILFDESSAGGGAKYSVYIRRVDGSPAIRLGDGLASSLSPDQRWAICIDSHRRPSPLIIVPTGAGEIRHLITQGLHHEWGSWFPDGKTIVFTGVQNGNSRLYVQRIDGGNPRPISPDGARVLPGSAVSSDGRWIAALQSRLLTIYPADGGQAQQIRGLTPAERFIGWSSDPRFLFTVRNENWHVSIERITIATGKREHWTDIVFTDLTGLEGRGSFRITPDGNTIAFSFARRLTNLHLVDGVR